MPLAMRRAFGQCIGKIHAVPVRGSPEPSFVLEVDVTPDSDICKDMVFSFVENGKVRSPFRQHSSNISNAGKGAVKDAARWRENQQRGGGGG